MKEPDPLTLIDVVRRAPEPAPWAEGDNIPWHEPGFSARMLREHLSQEHDAASRRAEKIDGHVRWIHNRLLTGRPTRVLDLGCGPGLYSSRLAALGHECTGIDYSPASIEYATRTASEEHLQCTYRLEDIRTAEYGTGFGLAMLIYGELNIFRADDAALILHKAYDALDPGGILLLEPHTVAAVQAQGKQGCTWRSAQTGLFSDEPHVYLTEGVGLQQLWDTSGNREIRLA